MKATQIQLQLKNKKSIDSKLDEIIMRLDALANKVNEEIYPDESRFKKSYIKKQKELDKKIKSGKMKMHVYKNFAELDRAVG
jgi:hypothetical protein